MKKLLIAGMLALAVSGCQKSQSSSSWPVGEHPIGSPSLDCRELVLSSNGFAVRLYKELSAKQKAGNIFVSPSSLHAALTMTYGGAHGNTAEQMASALALPTTSWSNERIAGTYRELLLRIKPAPDAKYQLCLANAIWKQSGAPWNPAFFSQVTDNYGAALLDADFTGSPAPVCKEINRWVNQRTNGKISYIIGPDTINAYTRMVLTNVIYFKGEWESRFKRGDTHDEPFYVTPDKSVKVPMMHQEATFFLERQEHVQTLKMHYVGQELSMIIILPDRGSDLAEVEKNLPQAIDKAYLDHLGRCEVAVWFPKFTLDTQLSLEKTLGQMGMKDAFNSVGADLTGISTMKPPLYVSDVLHKSSIEVNERGTEAVTTTVVLGAALSAGEEAKPVFRADHPFIYIIRHEPTGAILFMGRVADPSKN